MIVMPLERDKSLNILADALEQIFLGHVPFTDLRLSLPRDIHPDVMEVLCNVEHYLSDADIRRRDPYYKSLQDTQMFELIAALRRGDHLDKLMSYNFLTFSKEAAQRVGDD